MHLVAKRLFLLTALCALSIAMPATPAAHASQSTTCDFDGMLTLNTPIPPPFLRPDTTGTYNMSAMSHACALTDSAGNPVASGTARMDSSGTFSSIECGTGNASGTGTISFSTGQTYFVQYTAFSAGAHGVMRFFNGPSGTGVVEFVPGDAPQPVGWGFGGNCVTTDVSQVRVRGAFSLALP